MTPQLGLTSTGNPAHIVVVAQEEEAILGAEPFLMLRRDFSPLNIYQI